MEQLLRNWRAIRSIVGDEGLRWMEYARRFYLRAFITLVIAAIITLAVMVGANFVGVKGLAFWLVIPFLIVWALCQFYPAVLLTLFGVGSLDGLPKDWSLNRLLKERELPDLSLSAMATSGLGLIRKIVLWGAQVALFVIVLGVVLGTWELENPKVVVPVLVILTGIGLWTAVYPTTSQWYRRIVISILLVAVALQLWDGYVSVPTQKKATATVTGFSLWKTQEKSLTLSGDLGQVWKVCGLEPGKWKYDLVGNPTIEADTGFVAKIRGVPQKADPVFYPRYRGFESGPKHDWALLADGVAPLEELVIGKKGCVEMSVNMFSDILQKVTRQKTQIKDPKEVEIVFTKVW